MKRKNKKQNKILPVILAAVAGRVFAVFKVFNLEKLFNKPEEIRQTSTSVAQEQGPSEKIVNSLPASTQGEPKPQDYQEKQPVTQFSGEDPNNGGGISGAITYTGISNDTLIIRVNLDQYIREGNCILTVSGAQTNYTEAARVMDSASTSTCEGFNVPLSFIKDKAVNIIIEVKSDDKSGVIKGQASVWRVTAVTAESLAWL